MIRLPALVALVVMPVFTAFAQSPSAVEKPELKVGDRWVFRNVDLWKNEETSQFEQKVTAADGDNIDLEATTIASKVNANVGTVFKRKADRSTWTFANRSVVEGKYVTFAFPLEVGKTWDFQYSAQLRDRKVAHQVSAKVEAWEDVQVPAGKFKALKVVHSDTYQVRTTDGRTWSERLTETFWYAPEVKRFVKREFIDRTGDKERGELTVFEVK
jgi:hypothetical protein